MILASAQSQIHTETKDARNNEEYLTNPNLNRHPLLTFARVKHLLIAPMEDVTIVPCVWSFSHHAQKY